MNKTYITIKHLGSGTFGRVMLCFNVYDQRLYAIKVCRKSQFASNVSRYNSTSRLRRSNMQAAGSYSSLQSPSSSSCIAGRSCGTLGGGPGVSVGTGGGSFSCATPAMSHNNSSCGVSCCAGTSSQQGVTNICATSGSSSLNGGAPAASAAAAAAASAAAAAALFGSSSGGGGGGTQPQSAFAFPARTGWPVGSPTMWQQQQHSGQLPSPVAQPPSPPSPPSGALPSLHQHMQQQQQQQSLPAQRSLAPSPVYSARCGVMSMMVPQPPPPPPPAMLSTGSGLSGGGAGGGFGGLMGTDCSTGSGLSGGGGGGVGGGGSVFQEALMRYQTEELVKEIAILKKLHHHNIVNLVEVIDDPSTDRWVSGWVSGVKEVCGGEEMELQGHA